MDSTQLPVRTASGDLVQYIEPEVADALPFRYTPHIKTKMNKKGKLVTKTTGYTLVPFPPHLDQRPDSILGLAFRQHLSRGFVYALHGTIGSGHIEGQEQVA